MEKNEKILEYVCDHLCKYPVLMTEIWKNKAVAQEYLDDICEFCPLKDLLEVNE